MMELIYFNRGALKSTSLLSSALDPCGYLNFCCFEGLVPHLFFKF